jgi:preprotein translocase subunit YajC
VGRIALEMVVLVAQNGGDAAPQAGPSLLNLMLPFLVIGFLFYFLLIRPQKAEQARRQAMLAAVKKNDRVVTIGGIYGVVTNVQREQDEVTIKVDEATNTKLRVTLGSIARIIGEESPSETASGKS